MWKEHWHRQKRTIQVCMESKVKRWPRQQFQIYIMLTMNISQEKRNYPMPSYAQQAMTNLRIILLSLLAWNRRRDNTCLCPCSYPCCYGSPKFIFSGFHAAAFHSCRNSTTYHPNEQEQPVQNFVCHPYPEKKWYEICFASCCNWQFEPQG